MLKYYNYDIVFQEIPDEVTLAVNLTNCPHRCVGCHSPHLRHNIGEPLDAATLDGLLSKYGKQITCVCFMGGDREPAEVMRLARLVHASGLKTAWYSGRQALPGCFDIGALDYVKVGPYIESRGPLTNADTNQRMYRIEAGEMIDITSGFVRRH